MVSFVERPSIISVHVNVIPHLKGAFIDWQGKLNLHIVLSPGFVSLEFVAQDGNEWIINQRFSNMQHASEWQQSKTYQELLDELKKILAVQTIREELADETSLRAGVTEIFVTEVHPDKEAAFRNWSAKIHQAEAQFPGFRGMYIQSPKERAGKHWITLLQFDSIENLDHWLESSERKALLDESQPLISSLESNRVISPYIGWFASIAKLGQIPSVWKQTMLVLLVLFPIVVFEVKYLLPPLQGINQSLAIFISNAISVTLISFPMMPIAIWFLGWWLVPKTRWGRFWTVLGTVVVLGLYAIEVAMFWRFI